MTKTPDKKWLYGLFDARDTRQLLSISYYIPWNAHLTDEITSFAVSGYATLKNKKFGSIKLHSANFFRNLRNPQTNGAE